MLHFLHGSKNNNTVSCIQIRSVFVCTRPYLIWGVNGCSRREWKHVSEIRKHLSPTEEESVDVFYPGDFPYALHSCNAYTRIKLPSSVPLWCFLVYNAQFRFLSVTICLKIWQTSSDVVLVLFSRTCVFLSNHRLLLFMESPSMIKNFHCSI